MTKLADIPPLSGKGHRVGGDPADKSEHFYTCKVCGQRVDKRDLRQVVWHEVPEHEPLEMDA
ncbi:hypothetical protein EOA60_14065 [Mesorhizobium sp. M1A.F.Ca.IN.020.06.1.1]|uniref:hypothetical protein n=1 Tax=unclassified Mesorhizobium TaxID=325217 RepID=UPI000FCBB466|nr:MULTISPECIES: hypothetical protein [unclassified Mesorhizobium]RUV86909.1 hypothetical protein EOA51_13015 [Mesorhizobium sp. M1A.F.Ca.IN.020.32.1.1]RUW08849.1 hypothetical protein EOA46_19655 [Mesorhizobium sp. M1A.F.Ca.IN.022.05.2.1]RUW30149.1 hypothetical protein EOA60_14065 [Mesorhizobium sp. M1A.F.Ca.IN.020.06.1.1]RWF81627.1 MAG: hypothetical protein EOQ35_13120 [Mesorhizobium sp.]RWG02978.1 MAG: hypothetical protein EOQ38_09135 [Mesorhizobium sp.]